jgi:hypothetical protein
VIPAATPITIAFNQAVDPNSITTSFSDENNVATPFMTSVTTTTNVVSINVTGMQPGSRYNMAFHAGSAQNQDANGQFDITAPLFVGQSGPLAVSSIKKNGANGLYVTFNQAIGPGHGATISGGTGFSCTAYYENVSLNGGAAGVYPGEWPTGAPAATSCASYGININSTTYVAPVNDITTLRGYENGLLPGMTTTQSTLPTVATGYAKTWYIDFAAGAGCPAAVVTSPGCPSAAYGNTGEVVHFVFSHQQFASGQPTFHTVTGDAIPDTLSGMIM